MSCDTTQDLLREAARELRVLNEGHAETRRLRLKAIHGHDLQMLAEVLIAVQLEAANTVAIAVLDGLAAVAGKLDSLR